MKKHYIFKTILALFIVGSFHFQANAQIRLVEVDPATDSVTIHNFGGSIVDITNYYLCVYPVYGKLDALSPNGTLNLNPGAEVTVTSIADLVDAGGEVGLYINAINFANSANIRDYLQWIDTNGFRESVAVGAGIWSTDDAIDNSVLQPYQYNGDGSSSDVGESFWGHALSTDDFSLKGFSISPNPARSILLLKLPDGLNKVKVEVFDVLGKEIYNNVFTEAPINISDWSKGVYMVRVSSDKAVHTKRFLKQ